jgi:hypothetical protein
MLEPESPDRKKAAGARSRPEAAAAIKKASANAEKSAIADGFGIQNLRLYQ